MPEINVKSISFTENETAEVLIDIYDGVDEIEDQKVSGALPLSAYITLPYSPHTSVEEYKSSACATLAKYLSDLANELVIARRN